MEEEEKRSKIARASGTQKWKRGSVVRGNRKRSVGKRERERESGFFLRIRRGCTSGCWPGFRTFGRFFSRPFYLSRYYYSHPALRRLRIPRSPRFRRCGRRAGNRRALRPKENTSPTLPPVFPSTIRVSILWDCKNVLGRWLMRFESCGGKFVTLLYHFFPIEWLKKWGLFVKGRNIYYSRQW